MCNKTLSRLVESREIHVLYFAALNWGIWDVFSKPIDYPMPY